MRKSVLLFTACLFVRSALAQSGAVIPEKATAGHAQKASCVLLKRMGPADQVTSRLYSFGIRGKQFQYVEGKLPDGFPFHGRLTDHDVRNLQARGAEVIVLNQNYTDGELKQGRTDCQSVTGETPMQGNEKLQPATTQNTAAPPVVPAASIEHAGASPSAIAGAQTPVATATVKVSSTPDSADIEVDGNYVGSTPSTVGLAAGQHEISVKKPGFKPWKREISVSSGQVNVNAALEPDSK
ncbi:MAG TPA: PEGA domain-containing protein [Terriglobales bacterium]|nr:PEGA domain-containing protein [Terriglobales bacterium]